MKKLTLVLAILTCSLTGSNLSFAQNTDAAERKQLFNYDWKFARGLQEGADTHNLDDRKWQTINLPHDWSIEGKIDSLNPSGNAGGYFPTGIGWYRKEFKVPDSWKGKKVGIYFEGVYMDSEVIVNGQSLGVHPYGYSSFYYDITPHLQYGRQNLISVRVNNSEQQNSRWYSGSGIYRHVWLYIKEPVHITHRGVQITTPEVSSTQANVQVSTWLKNETTSEQKILLSTQLSARENKHAGNHKTEVQLPPNSQKEVTQTIEVASPNLWSPETPHLYKANIQIQQNSQTVDEVTESFGIRSIAFDTENGFQLNGKPVTINGGNVHHDNGVLGAKAFDRAEERKVELLKKAGFNAVRTAHNPPSEAFLEACDRLGLMVMDEAFDGWRVQKTTYDYGTYFDNWWKEDVSAMVKRDRNHPSIIMWSTGNEIIERTEPEAVKTGDMLANTVRSLDSTRPVTSGMTTWGQGWERFDSLFAVHDIGGYNYQLHRAESDHERVPSRVIVQTESYPADAFANWELVQKHDYIIGDFVWTAMDYLGESGIGRYYYPGESQAEHYEENLYPWHGAYCGDIDLIGWRKPISHYRSMLYNGDEKLYMAVREPNPDDGKIGLTTWAVWPTWESWTWPAHEGEAIEVEIYSRYPAVRLYKDNKLIGEQPTTKEEKFKATFSVPYSSGQLKAVGMRDGNEIEETTLKTAGEAAGISLKPDRTALMADGQDLSFVSVEITDKNGRRQPNADNELTFSIEGPGTIEAVGNANLRDTDPYSAYTRKAWKGRAIVVIRSTRDTGKITLQATAPGLTKSETTISSSNR